MATHLLKGNLACMRYFIIPFLFPFTLAAQCPDPDSVLAKSNLDYPRTEPPWWGIPPYIVTYPAGFAWVISSNGKIPLPPVNNDPEMGQKKWLKNGFCRIYRPNVEDTILLATGRYLNRQKTGLWTWYDENGDKTSTGRYTNGLKTGLWKEYNETGYEESGLYVAGRKQGEWKKYSCCEDPERQVVFKENYHQGLLHGPRSEYESGRKTAQTNYANGWAHGKHIHYDYAGRISEISNYNRGSYITVFRYEEGKMTEASYYTGNKQKQIYYQDGKIREINFYKNSQRHGESVSYDSDRKITANYLKDKKQGPTITYKKVKEQWVVTEKLNYDQDSLSGKQEAWLENGVRQTWYCVSGKKHGLFYELSQTGDTLYSVKYVKDAREGREFIIRQNRKLIMHYVHEQQISQKIYEDEKLISDHYFRNRYLYEIKNTKEMPGGKLKEETYFADGKLKRERIFWPQGNDSLFITDYFPSGKIKAYSYMVKGQQQGNSMALNNAGDTLSYRHYEKNRLTGRNIFHLPHTSATSYLVKTFYADGMRTGKTEIYFLDSTIRTAGKTVLLAEGEMYKNLPFRHWNMYYADGTLKYDGCLCGLSVNMGWTMANPEGAHPDQIMNYSNSCGDFTRYYANGIIQEKYQGNEYESYSEQGILKTKGRLVNRQKEGKWTYYDLHGVKTGEEIYKNGIFVPANNQ